MGRSPDDGKDTGWHMMNLDDAKRLLLTPHDKYNIDLEVLRTLVQDLMTRVDVQEKKIIELLKTGKGKR